ncbi:signal peptidase I [Bacillus sp. JJ1503]|uniref:signal peptidase I SipW n=1 Tax=unclassified Bacillus (in: firmicutes) TaxID=185979 RepID=UPI002FFF2201
MKKVMKGLSNAVTILLFLLLILMAMLVISSKASGGEPQILGYQLKNVLSGSMEPTFKTGSIIAVKPGGDTTRFKKDDVITYMEDEQKIVTHRVIDVVKSGDHVMYQTKGDNNEHPDSNLVLSDNVVGEYTGFSIPYIGYFIDFAKSKAGTATLLIGPGVILLLYSAISIFKALKEIEHATKRRDENQGPEKTA